MSRFIPYLLAIATVFVFSAQKSYALTDASDLRCRYSDDKGNATQFFKISKGSPLAPGTGTLLSLENGGPLQYHVSYFLQKTESTSILVGAENDPEFDENPIRVSLHLKKTASPLLAGSLEISNPGDNEFYSRIQSYTAVCCDRAYPLAQSSGYACEPDTSVARLKLITEMTSSHFNSDVKVRLIQSLLTF